MRSHEKIDNLTITGNLRLGKSTTGKVTSTAAELNILDGVTATAAELNIMDGVTATAAEINNACDVSTRLVAVTAGTLSLTAALHANRVVTLETLTGTVLTLPAATGTGDVYTVVIKAAATSNAHIIQTSAGTEHMVGSLLTIDSDVNTTSLGWGVPTNTDTITMNGTATGGKPGDTIILTDYEATNFTVSGHLKQSGGSEVTPFSAAV